MIAHRTSTIVCEKGIHSVFCAAFGLLFAVLDFVEIKKKTVESCRLGSAIEKLMRLYFFIFFL